VKPGKLKETIAGRGFTGELKLEEQLSGHTSLRVGGPASLVALPAGVEDLVLLLEILAEKDLSWMVLGGGTNLLFANGGYHGCVIRLPASSGEWGTVNVEGQHLVAGAAASLPAAVTLAAREGLSGLEGLAGIPGTVGGALRMNAGTRSGRMADVVEKVQLLERVGDGDSDWAGTKWLAGSEVGFTYRNTGLTGDQVVLAVEFSLRADDTEAIQARMKEQARMRKETQPLGEASAGCWFKNPEGDSAGRLIDAAGMKGMSCGGARVSQVHANFFVNTGSATAADFIELAGKVRNGVRGKFGIELEEEIQIIGVHHG
jgi:UDP-N-acetylmuramate dehydrogenase